jgi:hypothetical protein
LTVTRIEWVVAEYMPRRLPGWRFTLLKIKRS